MNGTQRRHARDVRLAALSARMGCDDPNTYLWDAYVLWREQETGPAAHIHRAIKQGQRRCVTAKQAGIKYHGEYYEQWHAHGTNPPARVRRMWWRNFKNYLARHGAWAEMRHYGDWKWRTAGARKCLCSECCSR